MTQALKLYNTFTRLVNPVELSGKLVTPNNTGQLKYGSLYICGPTVYSDSHVGHALTYIRADLLRRFLRSIFNVKLITVMNITDIDDKILARANEEFKTDADISSRDPLKHPFNQISDKYFRSFMKDMRTIRNQPPDLCIKISQHIHLITEFISRLELQGRTYFVDGDIYFKVGSINSYVGRVDPRQASNEKSTKHDPRDFVLWKSAKPNEPVWSYQSPITKEFYDGRPGWHVQCSAISSSVFGGKLDIHFGGKDLIFPHHYNEEACCCAYHNLDTSSSMHVWAKHWLHSGHLILRDSKMSKSLGNVISIQGIVDRSSTNALRLLCVRSHYRTDIEYSNELLDGLKALDHKISAFGSFLHDALKSSQENLLPFEAGTASIRSDIEHAIETTNQDIIEGVCEDLDFGKGLQSILDLAHLCYTKDVKSLHPKELVACWSLLTHWCDICGLEYGFSKETFDSDMLNLLLDYRHNVRAWAIDELRVKDETSRVGKDSLLKLLNECDRVRNQIDRLGFVVRDPKTIK